MADVLDADSVRSAVAVLDGWEGGPDAIVRTVGLRSFPAAIAVVAAADGGAELATAIRRAARAVAFARRHRRNAEVAARVARAVRRRPGSGPG